MYPNISLHVVYPARTVSAKTLGPKGVDVATLVLWAGCCMCPDVAAIGSGRLHSMGVHPTSPR